ASSALLPDGKVLVELSPNGYKPPVHYFLFDGASLTQIADNATAATDASNYIYMLVLPTGQVLVNDGTPELYSDGGTPDAAWEPHVTSVPNDLTAGDTYTVSGTQLNGLSDGAAFGDDWQMSSDYPLVQITQDSTGTVTYARTFGMTNRSIAPGAASSSQFALSSCTPEGSSELRVVADGIASAAVPVTVGGTSACTKLLTVTRSGVNGGTGSVTSSPAGLDCGSTCSYAFADGSTVTLTPHPAAHSVFTGWSGACTGKGACTVTLTSSSSVNASFAAACVVPGVKGKRFAAAKRAIGNAFCSVGKVRKAFSKKVKSGRVISQQPRAKTTLRFGAPVRLAVSKGKKHR
ncbi:MAG TPA: PASTA domain-containing protein, partial [Gaiellaceae bacterium]|nr:PASTA domain-containing protein [Gaiellaceae bacterium]